MKGNSGIMLETWKMRFIMILFYHSLYVKGNLLCSTSTLFAGQSRGDGGMSHENDSSWWSRESFSTLGFFSFGVVAMSLKKCCKTKLLITVLGYLFSSWTGWCFLLCKCMYWFAMTSFVLWVTQPHQECVWYCKFEFYLKIAAFHIKLVRTSTLVQKNKDTKNANNKHTCLIMEIGQLCLRLRLWSGCNSFLLF